MRTTIFMWTLAAAALYVSIICGYGHAETVITLKDSARIDGSQVRLGDIADISGAPAAEAGKLARVEIAAAPRPGHSKEIHRDFMAAKLHQLGCRDALFRGPISIIATTNSQTVAADRLEETLRSYIESHMPWKAADTVIDINPPSTVAGLPAGKMAIRFECDGDYRYVGDTTFKTTVVVGGKPCKTMYMRASVHPFARVAVSTRDIKRGELISDGDCTMVRKDLGDLRGGFFTDRAPLRGLVAARSIKTGSVISTGHVDRPVAVKRGKVVAAEVRGNGFRITAMAKAMDNGRVGDVIRLMNVASRKTLTGEVLDENTVKVVL